MAPLTNQRTICLVLFLSTIVATCASTREAADSDKSQLTLERIFQSSDFAAAHVAVKWFGQAGAYTVLESSAHGGHKIVQYDDDSNVGNTLVPAARLIPAGTNRPLRVDDYSFSADRSLLLIYTNSQRVWRRNTRGDYWVLDRSSHELRQLGGDARIRRSCSRSSHQPRHMSRMCVIRISTSKTFLTTRFGR